MVSDVVKPHRYAVPPQGHFTSSNRESAPEPSQEHGSLARAIALLPSSCGDSTRAAEAYSKGYAPRRYHTGPKLHVQEKLHDGNHSVRVMALVYIQLGRKAGHVRA